MTLWKIKVLLKFFHSVSSVLIAARFILTLGYIVTIRKILHGCTTFWP